MKVVTMAEKVFKIHSKKLIEANKDYAKRIESEGVSAVYDATLDALFLEIGEPKEALTEPLIDNVMIRIDPVTLKVVGVEIQDFLDDFAPANRIVSDLIELLRLNRNADKRITITKPNHLRIATVLFELAISYASVAI